MFFWRRSVMRKTEFWTPSPSPPASSAKLCPQHCTWTVDCVHVLTLSGILGDTEDGQSCPLSKILYSERGATHTQCSKRSTQMWHRLYSVTWVWGGVGGSAGRGWGSSFWGPGCRLQGQVPHADDADNDEKNHHKDFTITPVQCAHYTLGYCTRCFVLGGFLLGLTQIHKVGLVRSSALQMRTLKLQLWLWPRSQS